MSYGESFLVKIMLPSEAVVEDECELVNLPSENGIIGVLKGHEPLISNLVPGVVVIHKGNHVESYYVHGGVAHINNNSLVILTDFVMNLASYDKPLIQEKIVKMRQELESYGEDDTMRKLLLSKVKKYESTIKFIEEVS